MHSLRELGGLLGANYNCISRWDKDYDELKEESH